jgi:hypothetical protein
VSGGALYVDEPDRASTPLPALVHMETARTTFENAESEEGEEDMEENGTDHVEMRCSRVCGKKESFEKGKR